MKTRDERRKRQPLGSAPNTPTPTEASPLRGGIEQAEGGSTRWGRAVCGL